MEKVDSNTKVAHSLLNFRTSDVRLNEKMPFSKMMLSAELSKGLAKCGFIFPTNIQTLAIPLGRLAVDLLIQAKSGTGKTLIFAIIVLERFRADISFPQAFIITPTREIAVQIALLLNKLGSYIQGYRAIATIGGLDVASDRQNVQNASTIVATPGRLLHLINNKIVNTSKIQLLVLDEADLLLRHSFGCDIKLIKDALPFNYQIIGCSATFANDLDEEISKGMNKPLLISLDDRNSVLVGIKQFVYELPSLTASNPIVIEQKLACVRGIFSRNLYKQCVMFCNTKLQADTYRNLMQREGYSCDMMSSDMDQSERLLVFKRFREFHIRVLITTDLMARGVDFVNVDLVINLELPSDAVTYLHRIGRAGRFASDGWTVTFVANEAEQKHMIAIIEKVNMEKQVFKFSLKPVQVVDGAENKAIANEFDYYIPGNIASSALPLLKIDADTVKFGNDAAEALTETPSSANIPKPPNGSIETNTYVVNNHEKGVTNVKQLCEDMQLNISPVSCSQNLISSNTIDDASSIAADTGNDVPNSGVEASVEEISLDTLMKLFLPSEPNPPVTNPFLDYELHNLEQNGLRDDGGIVNGQDTSLTIESELDKLDASVGDLENSTLSTDRIAIASSAEMHQHSSTDDDLCSSGNMRRSMNLEKPVLVFSDSSDELNGEEASSAAVGANEEIHNLGENLSDINQQPNEETSAQLVHDNVQLLSYPWNEHLYSVFGAAEQQAFGLFNPFNQMVVSTPIANSSASDDSELGQQLAGIVNSMWSPDSSTDSSSQNQGMEHIALVENLIEPNLNPPNLNELYDIIWSGDDSDDEDSFENDDFPYSSAGNIWTQIYLQQINIIEESVEAALQQPNASALDSDHEDYGDSEVEEDDDDFL